MKKIIVIIGPTGSGKTKRSVELAHARGGEIVNADSRQVYKYLDVGTAKIREPEMEGVRHHLLSYVTPPQAGGARDEGELYSVSTWLNDARAAIDDIISRDRVPIICGGTGQYIDALVYGLADHGGPDYQLRAVLNQLSLDDIRARFYELKKSKNRDDEFLNNIDINNPRRLIRAIEILEHDIQVRNRWENRSPLYDVEWVSMTVDRELLRTRLRERAIARLPYILDEVDDLIHNRGVDPEWLATVGIEYRVLLASDERGRYLNLSAQDKRDIIDNIVNKSMQYAKRQETWNKKHFNI